MSKCGKMNKIRLEFVGTPDVQEDSDSLFAQAVPLRLLFFLLPSIRSLQIALNSNSRL